MNVFENLEKNISTHGVSSPRIPNKCINSPIFTYTWSFFYGHYVVYSKKRFHLFCVNLKNSSILLGVSVIWMKLLSNFFKGFHWRCILRQLGSYFFKLTPSSANCGWFFIPFAEFNFLASYPSYLVLRLVGLIKLHDYWLQEWLLRYYMCIFCVEYLRHNFPWDRLIARQTDNPQPFYSQDLNPPDYFLRGYLKDRVCENNQQTREDIIRKQIRRIAQEMLNRVVDN